MYIKVIITDLINIKEQLRSLEKELEQSSHKLIKYSDNSSSLEGKYAEKISISLKKEVGEFKQLINFIEEICSNLDEVIHLLISSGKIIYKNEVFIYDSKLLKKEFKDMNHLLSRKNFNKLVVENSRTFVGIIHPLVPEGSLINMAAEIKIKNNEKVFEYNKNIMNNLEDELRSINFDSSIRENDFIQEELERLNMLNDFPYIKKVISDDGLKIDTGDIIYNHNSILGGNINVPNSEFEIDSDFEEIAKNDEADLEEIDLAAEAELNENIEIHTEVPDLAEVHALDEDSYPGFNSGIDTGDITYEHNKDLDDYSDPNFSQNVNNGNTAYTSINDSMDDILASATQDENIVSGPTASYINKDIDEPELKEAHLSNDNTYAEFNPKH